MTIIDYSLFYRRFGVRRLQYLVKPLLFQTKYLKLPKNSLVHYVDETGMSTGPNLSESYYSNQQKMIMVDHRTELDIEKGTARFIVKPISRFIREYHLKNRRSRPLRDFETVDKDPLITIVESYAIIPSLYKYITSYYSGYNSWWNLQATLWNRVEQIAQISERNQFIFLTLPQVIPSLGLLRMAEKTSDVNKKIVDSIPESSGLMFLELWKWLGDYRANSVMSRLSPKAMEQTNLVWQESGHWFVLNLGLLEQWRLDTLENDSTVVQRRWLRGMISLFSMRSVQLDENEQSEVHEKTDDLKSEQSEAVDETLLLTESNVYNEDEKDIFIPDGKDKLDDLESMLDLELPESLEITSIGDTKDDEEVFSISDKEMDNSEIDRIEALDIDSDLKELDALTEPPKSYSTLYSKYQVQSQYDPVKSVVELADDFYNKGLMTPIDYKQSVQNANRFKKIPNPFKEEETLEQAINITPEEIKINNRQIVNSLPGVTDQSMLNSALIEFDQKYIEKILPKDFCAAVMGIQAAGICIQNYEVSEVQDLHNHYQVHKIKIAPLAGKPTTLSFKLPVVKPDGTFMADGSRYVYRKQRVDCPIRKVSPSRVALTSYYSKLFIERSQRKVNNYPQWLVNHIRRMGLDPSNNQVTELKLSQVFDHELKLPRVYSALASNFSYFEIKDYQFSLDYHKREANPKLEVDGFVVIGSSKQGDVLLMDDSNTIRSVNPNKGDVKELGLIEDLLLLPLEDRPLEYAEIGIMGQSIPLAFVLGKLIGLGNLLKTLNVNPIRQSVKLPLSLEADQYAVKFSDQVLIFKRGNPKVDLIMTGFNRYSREVKRYSIFQFDKNDVYDIVLESNQLGARYAREIGLLKQLWVDHITRDILIELNEPTDFIGLLFRSVDLLTTDWHPSVMDMEYMRDRGYERLAGNLYTELCRSIRAYKSRPITKNSTLQLNPEAVWLGLLQDPAKAMVEESNPIHNLKEKEVVVYSGRGGRNSRTMTAPTRKYHRSHMGIVSEATVDNSDVATTTYLVPDPNYINVRGISRRLDMEKDGPARKVSTSMLLSPGSDRDAARRVSFVTNQNSRTTFSKGYTPMPLRTGYERVIGLRTDDMFCTAARFDGVVKELSDKHIVVSYDNNTDIKIQLGRRYGVSSGTLLPHLIVTDLKVGQKISKGDTIAYNSNYFTKDSIYPNQAIWKAGILATTALFECTNTLEDSSEISQDLSEKLGTQITYPRTITVSFDQSIRKLVSVGTAVDIESILCTIENSTEGSSDLFDEESLRTLSLLSNLTPRSKYVGTVEKIEVYYNGDIEEMSDSLKELATKSDRQFKDLNRKLGKKEATGKVSGDIRIDGSTVDPKTVLIRLLITSNVGTGVGDKAVFSNQLKTTVGHVMTGMNETQSGTPIQAVFGYRSINDRIVNSAVIIGTTNTLLKKLSRMAVEAYKS